MLLISRYQLNCATCGPQRLTEENFNAQADVQGPWVCPICKGEDIEPDYSSNYARLRTIDMNKDHRPLCACFRCNCVFR